LLLKQEICNLIEWSVGNVHGLSSISRFMKNLGGCTQNGKLYWRLEEKQIVSIILKEWVQVESAQTIHIRKCILMGSPGVGKSTLLCLMVFYVVFEQKKNVLLYRKLMKSDQDNCLVYLGYENNQVKYWSLSNCEESIARAIYKKLRHEQEVWLMLDGFIYKDIPEGLRTFKMLATSQQVDLKDQERDHAYCCLHPCWKLKDLEHLGLLLNNWEADYVSKRYYYSGGSVREFLRSSTLEIERGILTAITSVQNSLALLSNCAVTRSGNDQVDRLRRTFVMDPTIQENFLSPKGWEQIIDSEFAVLTLSGQLKPDYLFKIYSWAKNTGHASLAESVFELSLHLLAADNRLKLYASKYDFPQVGKPRHVDVKKLCLQRGRAKCCGTATDYKNDLIEWRDDEAYVYWFPACDNFPNIDSIVKLKLDSGATQVAYLQITLAEKHSFDDIQLQTLNKIFLKGEQSIPPIYIVVCNSVESCGTIILEPANKVLNARRQNIEIFAGHFKMDSDISEDGPNNGASMKFIPTPNYELRKRARTTSFQDDEAQPT
ncbi:hypothetical protein As57867_007792, partial [Aphanomyces stellatus]